MFDLFELGGPYGLILFLAGIVGLVALIRYLFRTTPISSVHAGKVHDGCKFDRAEVRRTSMLATPPIDLSNLPPKDARVVAELANVQVADVEKALKELSGETTVTVGGKSVQIASRNTYHKSLDVAMTYLEEFYAGLGVKTTRVPYTQRGKKFYNLEAVFPGKETPEKVIVIGAHLDSTAGDTWRAEPVAPGANDDGSGTVSLKEIAKVLVKLNLKSTVRLVHFTGEEQGLWGSYTYSDKLAEDKTRVIAMFEMDMVGHCHKPGNRLDIHDDLDRNGSHSLVVDLVRNVARYGLQLNPVDTHNHAVHDRSDNAGFLDHGWKAVLISQEFSDDGWDPNYHSVNDRIASMNLPFMVETIKMVIATVCDYAEIK